MRPAPRSLSTMVATALLGGLLTACGTVTTDRAEGASDDGFPMTVRTCGRDVTLTERPARIVSMHPSMTELLVQLGLGDRVVAQAQDALGDPSPELASTIEKIPSLSSDAPPTKEDLLAQEPDLVVSGTEFEFDTEAGYAGYDELEKVGTHAYVATAGCVERRSKGTVRDTFTDVENLGRVFGVEDRADRLVATAKRDLAAVADTVGDQEPVPAAQVYVEGGKLYAIGGAIEIDVLRLGGGRNLFAGDGRFSDFFAAEVNPEVVLAKQPRALVFAYNDAKHERTTKAYLRKVLADTPAVRDGRLVGVDNTYVQPGTLAAITGARTVAEALHG